MFYSREHCDKLQRDVCYLLRKYDVATKNQQTSLRILTDTQVSI